MWSMALSFFTTMSATSWFKYVLIGIPVLILVTWLGITKYQYNSLQADYAQKQVEILAVKTSLSNALGTIEHLNVAAETKAVEILNVKDLLASCYDTAEEQAQAMTQIDKNMEQETHTPLNPDTDGVKAYEPVSQEQNRAGLEFVNTQLASML